MATSKPIATLLILLNLVMFAFVSTNAACPDLSACLNIAPNLVNVQVGSQASTPCCQLIGGLVSAGATSCVCNALHSSLLGSVLASVLNLADNLPVVGNVLSPLLGSVLPLLGGILGSILGNLPILGGVIGNLPLVGSLTPNVLEKELIVLVSACGLDVTKFTCSN